MDSTGTDNVKKESYSNWPLKAYTGNNSAPAPSSTPDPTTTATPGPTPDSDPTESEEPSSAPTHSEAPSTPGPTMEPKFDVTAGRNDDGTFNFTVTRLDESINDAAVFIGMYNEDDMMVGLAQELEPEFDENGNMTYPTVDYIENTVNIKIFVWGIESLEPYAMPALLEIK